MIITGLSIARYLKGHTKVSFYDENKISLEKARKLFGNKNTYFLGDLKEEFFDGIGEIWLKYGGV